MTSIVLKVSEIGFILSQRKARIRLIALEVLRYLTVWLQDLNKATNELDRGARLPL